MSGLLVYWNNGGLAFGVYETWRLYGNTNMIHMFA